MSVFRHRQLCLCSLMLLIIPGAIGQTVETTKGRIEGVSRQLSGKYITRYIGIPYAKPPIGEKRFVAPEEPDQWTNTLSTKVFKPLCIQANNTGVNLQMDEDCLYLNIFIPSGNNLSVMVWLHGGGYQNALMSTVNPEILAVTKDVIVVTFNYRLNIFGYFSTGDKLVEGNSGPMDQVMALRWIQDNIDKFGGEKTKVTIFGEGVGGRLATLHMASPMSKGLFQRAIVMGATGLPLDTVARRGATYRQVAAELNCSTLSSEMLKCFQNPSLSTEEIIQSVDELQKQGETVVEMATLGGTFLPKHPDEFGSNVDLMAGFTSEMAFHPEIITFVPDTTRNITDYLAAGMEDDDPLFAFLRNSTLADIRKRSKISSDNEIWQAVRDQYLSERNLTPQGRLRATLDMAGAISVLAPTMKLVQGHSLRSGKTYLYMFDQKIPQLSDPFEGTTISLSFPDIHADMPIGALEASDLFYIFGLVSTDVDPANTIYGQMDDKNRKVGAAMMSAWTSFAKTGIPEFADDNNNAMVVEWPEYNKNTGKYLEIKNPMGANSIKEDLLPSDTSFVTKMLPAYITSLNPPETPSEETSECEEERSVSTVSRDKAETALFILCAVVIVLVLGTVLLTMNYFTLKKELKKKTEETGKKYAPAVDEEGHAQV